MAYMKNKAETRVTSPRSRLRWCFWTVLALGCLGLAMLAGCGPAGRADYNGGVKLMVRADNGNRPVTEAQRDAAVRVLQRRLDGLELGERPLIRIRKCGDEQIEIVVLSRDGGEQLLERVAACVTAPSSRLEFRLVPEDEEALLARLSPDDAPPGFKCIDQGLYEKSADWQESSRQSDYAGCLASFGADRLDDPTDIRFALEPDTGRPGFYRGRFVSRKCWISSEHLKKVKAKEAEGFFGIAYIIEFTLTDRGTEIFAELTSANIDRQLAILCNDTLLSAPVIKAPITGGRGEISGNFTREEAERLASTLAAGELPVPFTIVSSTILDPSSGCAR